MTGHEMATHHELEAEFERKFRDRIRTLEGSLFKDIKAIVSRIPQLNNVQVNLAKPVPVRQSNNDSLKQDSTKIRSENEKLRKEVENLKKEVISLREERDFNKPLLEVGRAVRFRFLEQSRIQRAHLDSSKTIKNIIKDGNIAAHQGNILADLVLFNCPDSGPTGIDKDLYDVFVELYCEWMIIDQIKAPMPPLLVSFLDSVGTCLSFRKIDSTPEPPYEWQQWLEVAREIIEYTSLPSTAENDLWNGDRKLTELVSVLKMRQDQCVRLAQRRKFKKKSKSTNITLGQAVGEGKKMKKKKRRKKNNNNMMKKKTDSIQVIRKENPMVNSKKRKRDPEDEDEDYNEEDQSEEEIDDEDYYVADGEEESDSDYGDDNNEESNSEAGCDSGSDTYEDNGVSDSDESSEY